MKKFLLMLIISAMSVSMFASANSFNVNSFAIGNNGYGLIAYGTVGGFGCDIPGIIPPGQLPDNPTDDDTVIPPGQEEDTPSDDEVVIPPVQDDEVIIPPTQDDEAVTPPEPDSDVHEPESAMSEFEKEVVRLVNEIRTSNGLGLLMADESLSRVARIKSQDMKDNNYFSHTSPVYGSPFDMMKQFGISYKTAAENIAMGYKTPQAVVDGWMNSPGHRANILNASFNTIGVGYVASGNYWTQMFVGR